jgi:Ni,Fe-hydrogenase maturation factor
LDNVVYVFGNPLVKEDSLPLKIIDSLRERFPNIEFKEFDTVEDIEPSKELFIIDTVKGIRKAMIIEDIDSISSDKIYTMHDFDLGYTLKLWKKMSIIASVKIFGVPQKGDSFDDLCSLIEKTF